MKKIRIETKSGELVKEFNGSIEGEVIFNDEGTHPQVIIMSMQRDFLGLIVKEIEVEEKKPVVRWLWSFHHVGYKPICTDVFMSDDEIVERRQKYPNGIYKKLEWSATEFEE